MPELFLRLAKADDLDAIRQLLNFCNLPSSDLTAEKLAAFYVALKGDSLLGVAGLERAGEDVLLRSVAVHPEQRGTGLGKRLVNACREFARDDGARAIYLIPNDAMAQAFFLHLGCTEVPRIALPEALQKLPEFTHLCPQTHPCMQMPLRALETLS